MRLHILLAPAAVGLLTAARPSATPPPATTLAVSVRNHLPLARRAETISLPASCLATLLKQYGAKNLLVKNAAGQLLVSQAVDTDGDGTTDELLFQTDIAAGATQHFAVTGAADGAARQPASPVTTFSRLVPERIDDYAWENDRVGFRTYGPRAQQLTEAGRTDGTLTSGMDCWLKRTTRPVINQWYAANVQQAGYYHIDHGDGYDPYHVGDSRGFAGIGVWANDSLYVSKNFVSCKTLAVGPIRTLFELRYAPWPAAGRIVIETKRISLDLGSNLTRFEEHISADQPLPNVTIGTTLHAEPKGVLGEVKGEPKQGWFRYWEPMDEAFVGTGVVLAPAAIQGWQDRRTKAKEQSHLLVMTAPAHNRLVYYAGFGWTRSGQFRTAADWDNYLREYAQRLASPLEVSF